MFKQRNRLEKLLKDQVTVSLRIASVVQITKTAPSLAKPHRKLESWINFHLRIWLFVCRSKTIYLSFLFLVWFRGCSLSVNSRLVPKNWLFFFFSFKKTNLRFSLTVEHCFKLIIFFYVCFISPSSIRWTKERQIKPRILATFNQRGFFRFGILQSFLFCFDSVVQ